MRDIIKPKKIDSGIEGVELCPKCKGFTCFVLPDFCKDSGKIISYSCTRCKLGKPPRDEKWINTQVEKLYGS
jgi:hypothetical protein